MLYDKPVHGLMREMVDDFKQTGKAHFNTSDALHWFSRNYPKVKEGTIRAHLRQFSANDPNRLHLNTKPGQALLFKLGPSDYRMYDPERDPPEILPGSQPVPAESPVDEDSESPGAAPSEFAYEKDLQSFLTRNLHLLEPGLRLYEDEGINGIEFDAGGRRIDILAVDAEGGLVVIELKVSRGYDRVVGQLLRYMAWIEQHQADPDQRVRGIIVAREISDDLKLATARVTDVSLYEYQLAVTLQRIT